MPAREEVEFWAVRCTCGWVCICLSDSFAGIKGIRHDDDPADAHAVFEGHETRTERITRDDAQRLVQEGASTGEVGTDRLLTRPGSSEVDGVRLYCLNHSYAEELLVGPEMGDDQFQAVCQSAAQRAATRLLASGTDVAFEGRIADEMVKLLAGEGFRKVKRCWYHLASYRRDDEAEAAAACYGAANARALHEHYAAYEAKQRAEYKEKDEAAQRNPVAVLCEDAKCKNCGQPIMQPIEDPAHYFYGGWEHVREGYHKDLCSEQRAEPVEGSIVQRWHQYVRTRFPATRRVA